MLKIFKIILIAVLVMAVGIFVTGCLFVGTSPEFGGKHDKEDLERYRNSDHFEDGLFVNLIPTSMDMNFGMVLSVLNDYLFNTVELVPEEEISVNKISQTDISEMDSTFLVWFGHSAFFLQIDGKRILLDPMFGLVPAPHPYLGKERFNSELPIEIENLPQIDAIILSHDHYDHLDYGSIMRLKDKTKMFYVPLGVGAHLESWDIPKEQIIEMDWWQEKAFDSLNIIFAPSRHFSGRGLNDRFKTLWGSWIIQGKEDNIYFSGDGGYGPHFKEIGDKYGPFDFAMMECGQYDMRWHNIHMMPEETAQASKDLNAKLMMPIHWGSFNLALHSWTDPVVRVKAAADKIGLPMITPIIGDKVFYRDEVSYQKEWWQFD